MATNVKPSDLNYDHYENEIYDHDIAAVIPGYDEMHRHIEDLVTPFAGKSPRILELGIGTGLTAERILKIVPKAGYTGIDFSEQMLRGASKRLHPYDIRLVTNDFAEVPFEDQDIIVSVIGIHHQTHEGKQKLFRKISDALGSNGEFIFGDLMTYRDPHEAAFNEAQHYAHLVKNARDEQALKEWAHHHKFLNILAPLEDQVEWLKEAGFASVHKAYQKYNTVLLYAKKGQPDDTLEGKCADTDDVMRRLEEQVKGGLDIGKIMAYKTREALLLIRRMVKCSERMIKTNIGPVGPACRPTVAENNEYRPVLEALGLVKHDGVGIYVLTEAGLHLYKELVSLGYYNVKRRKSGR